MDRTGFLRQHADLAGLSVLEIGALANPVVAPGAADVRYLDHMSTHGLHAKYAGDAPAQLDEAERGEHAAMRVDVALRRRRSEERREGKECVSTCRSRWSPLPEKQKTQKHK